MCANNLWSRFSSTEWKPNEGDRQRCDGDDVKFTVQKAVVPKINTSSFQEWLYATHFCSRYVSLALCCVCECAFFYLCSSLSTERYDDVVAVTTQHEIIHANNFAFKQSEK